MVVMFLWYVQEVAGLKIEDLPSCDDIGPSSTAATVSKCELFLLSKSIALFSTCNTGTCDLSVKHLLKSCKSVTDWYTIGINLGLETTQLDDIHVTYHAHGVNRCKTKMFDVWLKSSPDASWTDLITALRDMDENTAASEIQTGKHEYILDNLKPHSQL